MNGNNWTLADNLRCTTRKSLYFKSIYQFHAGGYIPAHIIDDYFTDMDSDIDNELISFIYPDGEEYWDEDWED